MTGEMGWDDLKNYPDIHRIARKIQSEAKVAAEVRPFDVYQGPYIAVNLDDLPLKGTGRNRLGLWQLKVWYGDSFMKGTWVIEYRGHFMEKITPANVVRIIKELKKTRK
jgi:hypothetical protein